MQSLDAAMRLRPKRKLFGRGVRLQTEQDPRAAQPDLHPGRRAGDATGSRSAPAASPRARSPSRCRNIPTTAHILGGAVVGAGPESGVVDAANRVFGYENLLVCDGAAIPANPGVNPSLTITAMAEHAMSQIPPKDGAGPRHLPEAARPAPSLANVTARRRRGARRRSPS